MKVALAKQNNWSHSSCNWYSTSVSLSGVVPLPPNLFAHVSICSHAVAQHRRLYSSTFHWSTTLLQYRRQSKYCPSLPCPKDPMWELGLPTVNWNTGSRLTWLHLLPHLRKNALTYSSYQDSPSFVGGHTPPSFSVRAASWCSREAFEKTPSSWHGLHKCQMECMGRKESRVSS